MYVFFLQVLITSFPTFTSSTSWFCSSIVSAVMTSTAVSSMGLLGKSMSVLCHIVLCPAFISGPHESRANHISFLSLLLAFSFSLSLSFSLFEYLSFVCGEILVRVLVMSLLLMTMIHCGHHVRCKRQGTHDFNHPISLHCLFGSSHK